MRVFRVYVCTRRRCTLHAMFMVFERTECRRNTRPGRPGLKHAESTRLLFCNTQL
jgi:hypothetical protein